jgi:hypothetical protein
VLRGKHLILLEGSSGTLLGEALVADELGADSLERRVTLGLHLLDTVTVSLLVYLAPIEIENWSGNAVSVGMCMWCVDRVGGVLWKGLLVIRMKSVLLSSIVQIAKVGR